MGFHTDKNDIILSALNKISATASQDFSNDVSIQKESYQVSLNEIVAEAMEDTVYPFAVSFLALKNTIKDADIDPMDLKSIFVVPRHARIMGVFNQCNLPTVVDLITNVHDVNSESIEYSVLAGRKIIVNSKQDDLYLVFTDIDPPAEIMTANFQGYLTYKLAEVIYFRTSTNPNMLRYLRANAFSRLGLAKRAALLSSSDIKRRYVTLKELTDYGKTDGSV